MAKNDSLPLFQCITLQYILGHVPCQGLPCHWHLGLSQVANGQHVHLGYGESICNG